MLPLFQTGMVIRLLISYSVWPLFNNAAVFPDLRNSLVEYNLIIKA